MSEEHRRKIRLLRHSFPDRPAYDTALSRALLLRVSAGRESETFRLHEPGDVVAFGPVDRTRPGFPKAVEAAHRNGFEAVVRLAGGRAAVFHGGTLAFSWTLPVKSPRLGITARFEEIAGIVSSALRALGVDARVGEVPGEYCPGSHSVNARGRRKIMGVGQRVTKGAAHVGGVLVIRGADRVRDVLVPVYEALGIAWDTDTVGSVEEEIGAVPGEDVARAVLEALALHHDLGEDSPSPESLALADRLAPDHRAAPRSRG